MKDWMMQQDGSFTHSLRRPVTNRSLQGKRFVLTFKGLPVVGDSYSVYVYANETSKTTDADLSIMDSKSGFLERVGVFGHGSCGGDAGHCGFRSRETVDPRLPFHAAPRDITVDLTDAAQEYIESYGPISKLRVVPRVRGTEAIEAASLSVEQAQFLASSQQTAAFMSADIFLVSPEKFSADAESLYREAPDGAAEPAITSSISSLGLRVANLERLIKLSGLDSQKTNIRRKRFPFSTVSKLTHLQMVEPFRHETPLPVKSIDKARLRKLTIEVVGTPISAKKLEPSKKKAAATVHKGAARLQQKKK
jgi:hypothetical protein